MLPDDEAVMFADAVHPTHGLLGAQRGRGRPGRERVNIHGAIDLETAA